MKKVIHLLVLSVLALSSNAGERPNHLEPLDPASYAYDHLVYEKLLPKGLPLAWMLVKPSFFKEYSVTLVLITEDSEAGEDSCQLQYRIVKEKIWGHKKLGDGQMELDLKYDVEVELQTAILPMYAAGLLLDTWEAVLRKTRYPDERDIGLDGTTYEFNSSFFYGKTWSPKSGVPKLMVDCGELMIEYVKADEEKREKCLTRLNHTLRKLQEELE